MRIAVIVAALLFPLPATAQTQTDSFSRGFNDGYNNGFPASGDPRSPYVSGTENGAGARFLDDQDEDDARQRASDMNAQPDNPDQPPLSYR
jgi:hypothetical protein